MFFLEERLSSKKLLNKSRKIHKKQTNRCLDYAQWFIKNISTKRFISNKIKTEVSLTVFTTGCGVGKQFTMINKLCVYSAH